MNSNDYFYYEKLQFSITTIFHNSFTRWICEIIIWFLNIHNWMQSILISYNISKHNIIKKIIKFDNAFQLTFVRRKNSRNSQWRHKKNDEIYVVLLYKLLINEIKFRREFRRFVKCEIFEIDKFELFKFINDLIKTFSKIANDNLNTYN